MLLSLDCIIFFLSTVQQPNIFGQQRNVCSLLKICFFVGSVVQIFLLCILLKKDPLVDAKLSLQGVDTGQL